jgi:class 3 adenylate cyclase
MARRRRRIIAIMFTDMASYSVKMAKNEQLALELLGMHNRILTPIIEGNGGSIVKHIGDAIMGRFDDCQSAFRTGLQVQASISEYNIGRPDDAKISMRIGIHVGEVVEMDKDIFGHAVNLASRIQQLGSDGDVIATRHARDLVGPSPAFHYEFLQSATVKNIDAPIDLFRVHPGGEEGQYKRSLIVFSGPSGVGKDAAASRCREDLLTRDVYCGYLKKYTSRPETSISEAFDRSYEPSMAETHLTGRKALEKNPDIFFPYEKFESSYGFSRSHLADRGPYSALLLCVFDRIERLGEFRNIVQELSGRDVFVIHLNAPEKDLNKRLKKDNSLNAQEKQVRIEEMKLDLSRFRIGLGRCRSQVDLIIQNGSKQTLHSTVQSAVEGILTHIAAAEPMS